MEIQLVNMETIKMRPEDELLLSCARTNVNPEIKDKILSLVQEDIDWEYLVGMASRHRLMPLLYHNLNSICPEMVPEDILGQLKDNFHGNVRKNLLMTGELIKVLNLLESEGITAVPYKGPVLASMAYGNIGLRQFGDIDILINKSDALNVKDIIVSEGDYELYLPINVEDSIYLKLDSEYRFINKNTGTKVEINWSFEGLFFSFQTNPSFLFDNLEIFNINGLNFYTFSLVNQLLMICIHCAKHDWNHLLWLCDISEFIKINKNINWSEIMEKAEKLGVKRILLINFFLARDIFGLELPDEILSYLASDSSLNNISFQIKKNIFYRQKSVNIFEKFFLDLRKRDKLIYGIKDSINGLTRASYKDFQYISLPEFLFPLYYLIRPILLLKRYGKDPL